MSNSNGWGDGAGNNLIGWGQGAVNNSISWGDSHKQSWAGSTDIVGLAYETEYAAILDKATALGYTLPSEAVKLKQNTLLASMKADGVWAKLDVFYVFAVDNNASAFATLNWKNPNANQSTLVSSPTFVNKGGFQGNGTSSYIDTNFNPLTQGVQYNQNNASRYFFTHAIGTGRFDGTVASNKNTMFRGITNSQRINAGTNTSLITLDFTAAVNTKSFHRTSATDITAYNDTTGVSTTQLSAAMDSSNQFILRAGSLYGSHTCAAYAMGASMISEHSAFIADWNTYKNSL